jgi:two-component system CheB/CheR fusion protein
MPTSAASDDFRVVCLGGSAGGLPAYMDILRSLPANTGMAFVIAPHRAHENAHLLPQLLSTVTQMPVLEVQQGMRLEPDRVCVRPPRMDLTTAGPRAAAVILSGLDGDGGAALKAIKAAGGLTFAQSDAAYDSMPRSAVETGHVDYLMPAVEIAKALLALAQQPLQNGTNLPS